MSVSMLEARAVLCSLRVSVVRCQQ